MLINLWICVVENEIICLYAELRKYVKAVIYLVTFT
jgi:hypothetical protein